MTNSLKDLDFTSLTVAERLDLIGCIWDSIDDESKPLELTVAQEEELRRRIAHHDRHPGEFLTWDEVKSSTPESR